GHLALCEGLQELFGLGVAQPGEAVAGASQAYRAALLVAGDDRARHLRVDVGRDLAGAAEEALTADADDELVARVLRGREPGELVDERPHLLEHDPQGELLAVLDGLGDDVRGAGPAVQGDDVATGHDLPVLSRWKGRLTTLRLGFI